MLTEVTLSALYALLFLWLIKRLPFFRIEGIRPAVVQSLFLVKLMAGFTLFLIYTYYYPDRKYADIFRYFDDSTIIFNTLAGKPYDFFRMLTGYHSSDKELWVYYHEMNNWFNSMLLFNDARTMIRLNTLFRLFSLGTYYPVSIFFCFLAFSGLFALYKVVSFHLKDRQGILISVLFLMPSVLLWTSGIIKEAFLTASLGFTVYFIHLLTISKYRTVRNLLLACVFMFCLLNIKTYVLLAVMPGLISYVLFRSGKSHTVIKFASVHLLYIIFLFYASLTFTGTAIPERLRDKQYEFIQLAERESAGSAVSIPRLDGSFSDLVLNAPSAFMLTLARPSLPEADNVFMLLAAVENLLILLFVIFLAYRILSKKYSTEGRALLYFCLFFVTTIFCLIGWVTPILGAVVRYKVAALPYLMVLLVSDNFYKGNPIISSWINKIR